MTDELKERGKKGQHVFENVNLSNVFGVHPPKKAISKCHLWLIVRSPRLQEGDSSGGSWKGVNTASLPSSGDQTQIRPEGLHRPTSPGTASSPQAKDATHSQVVGTRRGQTGRRTPRGLDRGHRVREEPGRAEEPSRQTVQS